MSNSRLIGTIAGVFDAFREARRAVSAYERLDRMSDATLARRGLSRGSIVAEAIRSSEIGR